MTPQAPFDYRQHLELETPEQVLLDYELAGVGSRMLAALIDWAIVAAMVVVAELSTVFWHGRSTWPSAMRVLVVYAVIWGYFSAFEGLRDGQTPGKRRLGIRVIRENGHGISFGDAAARNLLLPIDFAGGIGIIMIAAGRRAKRLGDFVAGTVVVRDQPIAMPAESPLPAPAAEAALEGGTPELGDEEFRLLHGFLTRAADLPAPARTRLAQQLAERFAIPLVSIAGAAEDRLRVLHDAETVRRSGRFGGRVASGASSNAVAQRLVLHQRARWDEFGRIAARITVGGLDALSASELPDFAARYREVAADLARARTYRADAIVQLRLERLVAAGHNALYRDDPQTWRGIWRFISRDSPAAVLASWRYVLMAFLVFMVPAAGGYALLRARPALAAELLPDVMLERAEAGAARSVAGKGYVEAEAGARPLMATSIITNNVRVAFSCFASGIVFGVGSLVSLAFNGLQIGAASGYFANAGLLGYLWTFIIGHGALELFAIWVAGAAGFRLGLALIAPGELARRDALVVAGRVAIRMIGAVVVLLVIAGTIEGMISSSASTVGSRIAVSVASMLFLVVYLLNGLRAPREMAALTSDAMNARNR